ncbi:FadR/GntR family transcriptional regulator [Paenibacillus sp. J2TS4]|uniref:FadR/GntR family transcriptional regulator n=1 Tax=Paenibacillus sp. J2TS4 TaxID=2807194 RepID=UPI001BCCF0CE|nr:FadR/GntR family transcriptional regulator [Paenibacillus sp. J2TS4]
MKNDLIPIENKKIFELILNQILDLIAEKKLLPGDEIMPERELAQTLNVSRSSIREAFKVLEVMDLIEVKPREGKILKVPSVSSLLKLFPMMLLATHEEPHGELYEIRKCFEVCSAQMAAERRTEEDLKAIKAQLDRMLASKDEQEDLISADVMFHRAITQAAGNSLFNAVMEVIAGLMQYSVAFTKKTLASYPNYNNIIYEQHYDIYMAIKDQNGQLAGEKMFYHIDYSQQRVNAEFINSQLKSDE